MQTADILVLDFGSQYTQLIARRLREQGVYTELIAYDAPIDKIKAKNPKGLILSGGPASVYAKDAYFCDDRIFELGIPILGICYGMQLIAHKFGASVVPAGKKEYGKMRERGEFLAILPLSWQRLIAFIYVKDGILMIAAKHPAGLCELKRDSNINLIKDVLKRFVAARETAELCGVREIKFFVADRVMSRRRAQIYKAHLRRDGKILSSERAKGEFENKIQDSQIYKIFEEIRGLILANRGD